MTDTQKLRELLAKATPGPWHVNEYDCGDVWWYDHNGPCPSIDTPNTDSAIVHWDGFKQQYWSSANGNQKQIEANAALIVAAVNALPELLDDLKRLRKYTQFLIDQADSLTSMIGPDEEDDWCISVRADDLRRLERAADLALAALQETDND